MKTAIIITDGLKQIMFTPENKIEKQAIKLLSSGDDITVEFKEGTAFSTVPPSAYGYTMAKCEGGYIRGYECSESLMLVLKPKDEISS